MGKYKKLSLLCLCLALLIEFFQYGLITTLGCLSAFILAIFLGKGIWALKKKIFKV